MKAPSSLAAAAHAVFAFALWRQSATAFTVPASVAPQGGLRSSSSRISGGGCGCGYSTVGLSRRQGEAQPLDAQTHGGGRSEKQSKLWAAKTSSAWDNDAWLNCFQSADTIGHYELQPDEGSGAIPSDMSGTVYSVGPAKFEVQGQLIGNPFRGDGMACAVSFADGKAYFRNDFIKTKGMKKERLAGKVVFSKKPLSWEGGWVEQFLERGKNVANRGIVFWGNRLHVMWDSQNPWKVDPKNLETFFQDDVRKQLKNSDAGGGESFGARPMLDAKTQRLVNAGVSGGGNLALRAFNDKYVVASPPGRVDQRLPNVGSAGAVVPAFGLTSRYAVFSVSSLALDRVPYTLGFKSIEQALTQDVGAGTVLALVPRNGGSKNDPVTEVKVDAHMCVGVANAFDDDSSDSTVVIDLIRANPLFSGGAKKTKTANLKGKVAWDKLDYGADVPLWQLVRYTVNTAAQTHSSQVLCHHHVHEHAVVAPSVSAQKHRYVYAAIGRDDNSDSSGSSGGGSGVGRASPPQGIVRIDTEHSDPAGAAEKWFPEEDGKFTGAISFVPRAAVGQGEGEGGVDGSSSSSSSSSGKEDDGYIVATLLNGKDKTTEMVILDASAISSGPVCRLPIKGALPPSTHATFAEGITWAPDILKKSFLLVGLFRRKGWSEVKSDFSGLGMNTLDDLLTDPREEP